MAGERWTQKAVKSLRDYLAANYATQLRAVETAQGLAANSIPDPVEYIAAKVPKDNRVPLVQCYETRWSWTRAAGQRNLLLTVDCEIVLTYASDADLGAGELMLRRYQTALLDCLKADPKLANTVVQCAIADGDSEAIAGDASSTRMLFAQGVVIDVMETT